MKRKDNIIIITLIIIILIMSIAYSAFASELTLNGIAEIIGKWDVKITGVEISERTLGCESEEPEYTDTTATFHAKLTKPGDLIIYEIIIKNEGTMDAILKDVEFTILNDSDNSSAIKYVNDEPDEILLAGEETTLMVAIMYDTRITQEPSNKNSTITGEIEYVQKDV